MALTPRHPSAVSRPSYLRKPPRTLKSSTSSPCHHCAGAVWCSTVTCIVCPRPALLGFIWLFPQGCSCSLGRLMHCQLPCHCPHTLIPMPLLSHPQSQATALTPSFPGHCPHALNPMPLPSRPRSHASALTPSIPCHCPHTLNPIPLLSHPRSHAFALIPSIPCLCPHTINPMPLPSHPQSHAIALTPSIPNHCPHALNPMPLPSHPQSHAIAHKPSIPCHCPHILQSPHTQHVYQVHYDGNQTDFVLQEHREESDGHATRHCSEDVGHYHDPGNPLGLNARAPTSGLLLLLLLRRSLKSDEC